MKELCYTYVESVADFFYRRNGGTVVSPAYNIIECGLRYSAKSGKLVYCYVVFFAKLYYSQLYSTANVHKVTSKKNALTIVYTIL